MTNMYKILRTITLAVALLAAGQGAWATTKTVTYTITSVESINLNYDIVFTRSGDAPFDASQTTYTATVSTSSIGQTSGGAGGFSVELADGFKLDLQWGSGSNVQFITENCIIPRASGKYITYTVSCSDTYYYYTTHVMMTGTESGFQHGMPQTYPGSGSIDTDYDSVWGFSGKYYSSYSFGQITVTYSDSPALSIFESAGTDTYNIKDKDDLRHLANYVNNGGNDCQGLTFLQTQDITYTHTTTWNDASSTEDNYTAIGTNSNRFCGTFDGQNHTISGIRIYKPDNNGQGLFGYIGEGTVRGVNLADARITGYSYVGGIAGIIFSATVEDCFVAADACIHDVKSSSSYHGGIVGYSQGNTVQRCLSRASLTVAQNATSCKYYGAIIGENSTNGHAVKDCIAIGATVPNISNYRGAIIGDNNNNNSTYVQRNYYRACSVAGVENATGVGVGYDDNTNSPHDLTDNQGAQALYSLTLPSGVTLVRAASATLPGTGNKTYTSGADIDGTPYAYATATLSLSYDAAAIPDGYDVLLSVTQTVSGDAVSFTDHGDHTYTISSMPAADITVSVTQIPVISYIDADGNPQSHGCIPIVSGTNTYQTLGRTEG